MILEHEDVPEQNYNCLLKVYFKKDEERGHQGSLLVVPSQFLSHCQMKVTKQTLWCCLVPIYVSQLQYFTFILTF